MITHSQQSLNGEHDPTMTSSRSSAIWLSQHYNDYEGQSHVLVKNPENVKASKLEG